MARNQSNINFTKHRSFSKRSTLQNEENTLNWISRKVKAIRHPILFDIVKSLIQLLKRRKEK